MAPVLQEQLPKHLADKVVDVLKLDLKGFGSRRVSGHARTHARGRRENRRREGGRLMREYRARGLAVAGPEDTLEALANGQVDELLISASLELTHGEEEPIDAILAPEVPTARAAPKAMSRGRC
jgi:peptide subunit release factor 1 (eRF1)